jgi:hypothetical protein
MNFLKNTVFTTLILAISLQLQAQIDVKFGFRAGMTIANMMTDSFEFDADGNQLERFRSSGKISVGATVAVPFNDYIGMTGEVLFSQKGARYRFEGENSYLILQPTDPSSSSAQYFQGHKRIVSINITNNYVEVPILFYVQPIKNRLQLDFGPSISFNASSRALGILKYGIIDDDNPNPEDFLEIGMDHRYFRDEAGAVASETLKEGRLDQTTILYPASIGGYYFFNEKNKPKFSVLDFGLNFGASLYFTEGLRIGGRFYYGLTDVTNNEYDVSQTALDANRNFIPRDDFDRNIGIQLFVALQF